MDRSSRQLQELDGLAGLQSLRRSFSVCRLKYASSMVGYMRISIGEKQLQAERPRAMPNLRALDRRPHGVILGYASLPLPKGKEHVLGGFDG